MSVSGQVKSVLKKLLLANGVTALCAARVDAYRVDGVACGPSPIAYRQGCEEVGSLT